MFCAAISSLLWLMFAFRNEIMTSNEFRQAIGMKPSKDPKADELRNANISQSSEEIAAQNKTITAGRDAVERSIANQNG